MSFFHDPLNRLVPTIHLVLRRDGHWEKRSLNLNYVLTEPIKSSISQSWAALFSSLPFDKLEARILELLSQLFEEFYESAPDAVKARAKLHSDICLEAMKGLLPRAFAEPKNLLAQAQKTISRSLDTHVSDQLCDVYAEAGAMTGRGMFRRQKVSLVLAPCRPPLTLYLAVSLEQVAGTLEKAWTRDLQLSCRCPSY